VTDTEETFYDVSADVSATVEETFYDVSPDVSADVSSGPCSHLPDEILMEIFSYLPPNQVPYSTVLMCFFDVCSVLDPNFLYVCESVSRTFLFFS
jgi:hypothetical protein